VTEWVGVVWLVLLCGRLMAPTVRRAALAMSTRGLSQKSVVIRMGNGAEVTLTSGQALDAAALQRVLDSARAPAWGEADVEVSAPSDVENRVRPSRTVESPQETGIRQEKQARAKSAKRGPRSLRSLRKSRPVGPSARALAAARLVSSALPSADRSRYAEEWHGELHVLVEGGASRLTQLRYVGRLARSVPSLRRALTEPTGRRASADRGGDW
jgi:hypothetical protein